jgi:CRISPR-associated protein Cmr4
MKEKKAADRDAADCDNSLLALFGASKKQAANENAGSLAVTDARLIAFPIRSLKGAFAWVTCPAALERLRRDLLLVGEQAADLEFTQELKEFEGVTAQNSPLIVGDKYLQLDDETLTIVEGDSSKIGAWIAGHLLPDSDEYKPTRARLSSHLVVVSDSDFTHIVKYATEITARIGLDYETKTVKDGALFNQEFVPTEAIFYSVTLVNASRMANSKATAGEMLQNFSSSLSKSPVLQIGGDETTGKGLCAVRLWTKENK